METSRRLDAAITLGAFVLGCARAAGLPPEPRNFKPHVTVARLRGSRTSAVADYLEQQGGFTIEPFEVSRFVLYSARASVGGGPYVFQAAYPLEI